MALHGGGHLELKKMHKGDFWGIFGIRLGRCPGIIPEKISFLQFYSRFLCFFHQCSCTIKLAVGFNAPVHVSASPYRILVQSNLEYCSSVWSPIVLFHVKAIESIPRDAIRCIFLILSWN